MAFMNLFRITGSLLSICYISYLLISSPLVWHTLIHTFHYREHPIRLSILACAILLNTKSIPGAWHLRVLGAMLCRLFLRDRELPQDALFKPVVTTGLYASAMECDYNLHKSNSTYFSDFDLGRSNLLTLLFRRALRENKQLDARWKALSSTTSDDTATHASAPQYEALPTEGANNIILGGVSCNFKREIVPHQRYEIWTRVLTWDQKWIYLVSWIVQEGAVKPGQWKDSFSAIGEMIPADQEQKMRSKAQKAVFATSIAKYVIKKGRWTISPETAFEFSRLMPLRPGDEEYKGEISGWNHKSVEEERLRGLELMKAYHAGDALLNEFPTPNPWVGASDPSNWSNMNVMIEKCDDTIKWSDEASAIRRKSPWVLGRYRDLATVL